MSILTKSPQYHFSKSKEEWIPFKGKVGSSPLTFNLLQLNVLFDERKGKKYFPNICFPELRYRHIIDSLFFGEAKQREEKEEEFQHYVIACNEVTTRFIDMLLQNEFCRNHIYISNIKGFGEHFGNIIMSTFPFEELFILDISKSTGLWRKSVIGILSVNSDEEVEEEGEEEEETNKKRKTQHVLGICNMHTSARDDGTRRKKELDETYQLFEEHPSLNSCENVMLVGDLNFMYENENKNIHSGYIDIWKELHNDKKGYTFDSTINLMHREIWPLGRIIGYDTRNLVWRLDRWLLKNRRKKYEVRVREMEIFANKPVFFERIEEKEEKDMKDGGSGSNLFLDVVESFSDFFFQKSIFRGKMESFLFPSDHFGLRGVVDISRIIGL